MKKIIFSFVMTFVLVITTLGADTSAAARFKDVPATYWANKQIEYLAAKGIIQGNTNGTFGPQNEVTRAQVAIMMTRALKLPKTNVTNPGFSDVKTDFYAYHDIAALTNAGIFPKTVKFEPNRAMTRGEMALVLVKAFHLSGTYSGRIYDSGSNKALSQAIHAMAANKITTIDEKGQYLPNQKLTRVQFSVFLARAIDPKFRQLAVQKDFLTSASKGKVGVCSVPFYKNKTIKMVRSTLGQPRDAFYWNGGYAQYYGRCAYYFDDSTSLNAKMTGIEYAPHDPDFTLTKAKQLLGQPDEEWYDDVEGTGWTLVYDLNHYAVFMSASEKHGPIDLIFFKGSSY